MSKKKKSSSSNRCPDILNQISPGVDVRVWFDGGPVMGRAAVFLGLRDGAASFLIDSEVVFIPCDQIQAVALGG